MTKILEIVKRFPEEISQYRLNTRVIESLAKQSNDPNSKVAISALTHFIEFVPLVPRLI